MLSSTLSGYGVELHALQEEDLELVRQWRNHPAVAIHMFSNEHISAEQQRAWYERVSRASDRAYYLFSYRGTPNGFASVTAPDGSSLDRAETLEAAIYLAPDSAFHGNLLAFAPALALNDACFSQLPCRLLQARVKAGNSAALRFNSAMGYHETSRRDGVVYLAMTAEDYFNATQQIKKLLGRQD